MATYKIGQSVSANEENKGLLLLFFRKEDSSLLSLGIKQFFSEEKKQKTFVFFAGTGGNGLRRYPGRGIETLGHIRALN